MDRVDFYYKQLVTEAELDAALDDVESAMWNLAVDIGLEGVVEGAVLTQTGTPSMNILASNPCRAYDQLGRRLYFGAQQTLDCSQDELGNPTVPSAGNQRWVMLALEFDRNLFDLRTDGNGASVYYERDEYFKLRVVNGVETSGTPVRPSAPSDALILGDVLMSASTTSILTTDIDTTRRQDFKWTTADKIGVAAGAWTKLDTGSTDVQAALDDVDTKIIAVEVDGDVNQDLIPPDSTKYLGSATQRWNGRFEAVTVYASLAASADQLPLGDASNRFNVSMYDGTIYNSLKPSADGLPLGDSGHRFDVFVYDGIVYNSLKPSTDGLALGDASNRFVGYLTASHLYGITTAHGDIIPSATGQNLGSAAARWDVLGEVVTAYGGTGPAGAFLFDAARSVTKRLSISRLVQDAWSSSTFQWVYGATWGVRVITGWTYSSSVAGVSHIEMDFADGITVTDLLLTWYQASGTAGFKATLYSLDAKGAEVNLGSVMIAATAAWQDAQAMGLADFTVDRSLYKYILRLDTPASLDCALTDVTLNGTVLDAGKAIL